MFPEIAGLLTDSDAAAAAPFTNLLKGETMFTNVQDFIYIWTNEFESTQKLFKNLTDKSLAQSVVPGGRSLGALAWHIVTTIPEMMGHTGLAIPGPDPKAPVPQKAAEISEAFHAAADALLNEVTTKWTDASLQVEDEMYGEKWKRSGTLAALVFHQIHHRGQMTVLMRQAGVKVSGVYGPSQEEWAAMGMKAPE